MTKFKIPSKAFDILCDYTDKCINGNDLDCPECLELLTGCKFEWNDKTKVDICMVSEGETETLFCLRWAGHDYT